MSTAQAPFLHTPIVSRLVTEYVCARMEIPDACLQVRLEASSNLRFGCERITDESLNVNSVPPAHPMTASCLVTGTDRGARSQPRSCEAAEGGSVYCRAEVTRPILYSLPSSCGSFNLPGKGMERIDRSPAASLSELRGYRHAAGLTQRELATRASVSQAPAILDDLRHPGRRRAPRQAEPRRRGAERGRRERRPGWEKQNVVEQPRSVRDNQKGTGRRRSRLSR